MATFWPGGASADRYWRCEVPARHLPGRIPNLAGVTLQTACDVQAGAAVFQGAGSPQAWVLARAFQACGIPFVLDVDNNGYTDEWPGVRMGEQLRLHRELVPLADAVIVSTATLADVYSDNNGNVHVCPNSVDPADFPPLRKPTDGVFRVGFAGTDGHTRNAPLIEDAARWAAGQPDAEVVAFGVQPTWPGVTFKQRRWTADLRAFRKQLQTVDVVLCPLIPDDFARCKSDVKALEAAMAGALPIMSDSDPYQGWAADAVLVNDAAGFLDAVRWAYSERDTVRRNALAARSRVLERRTIAAAVGRWREALAHT